MFDSHSVVDALVIVNDADGTLVSSSRSGRLGTVEVWIPTGGSVSAIHVNRYSVDGEVRTARSIGTLFDVQPTFDLLEVRVQDQPTTNTPRAKTPMTVSATVPEVGNNRMLVLSCGSERSFTGLTVTASGYVGCAGKSVFDLWVLAFDATGVPVGYGNLLDLPFREGGTAAYPVDVKAVATSDVRLLATGIPPGSESLAFYVVGYGTREDFDAKNSAHTFRSSLAMPQPQARIGLSLPAGAFDYFAHHAYLRVASTPFEIQATATRSASSLAFPDWSLQDLALFESRLDRDATNPARPGVSWAFVPDGRLGDYVEVILQWGLEQYPNSVYWWSASPPTTTSVRLPELPDEVGDLRPIEGERIAPAVFHRDAQEVGNYAEFAGAKPQGPSSNESTVMIRPGVTTP
jgi:hypothetical protein